MCSLASERALACAIPVIEYTIPIIAYTIPYTIPIQFKYVNRE